MDTGNYMANQMDDLIENGFHQLDEFWKDLDRRIEKFIQDNNYTWTVEQIVKEYTEKHTQGFYVSFSCCKIIEHFKEDLHKATGL
jgi:NurA-like 5'-3' nuclease